MEEAWKPIVGFEGYEVSNLGRVRSFRPPNGRGPLLAVPHTLKPAANVYGHLHVGLARDKKTHTKKVHQLVLEAFVGPRPEGLVTCHGPNGKQDNSLTNLEWGTLQKNSEDKNRDGTLPDFHGEKNPAAKLTEKEVLKLRELHASGSYNSRELAVVFNINQGYVWELVTRKRWRHI